MALVLLINNGNPCGTFDGYDNLSPLGGEVAKLVSYDVAGTDLHAKDVDDGYVVQGPTPTMNVRPVVSTTFDGTETGGFYLVDDGLANYGTLFGSVVGGTAGQVVSGGAVLGPNTMTGSGKVTLWKNPGLYGVTLDALNSSFTSTSQVTVGTALYFDTAGKLCLSAQKAGGSTPQVARLVEFSTGGTLVNTPHSLVRQGIAAGTLTFKYAVIDWMAV